MAICVHDVMQRKTVELVPRDAGRIGMYVCGPTVYGLIHIGNARTILWFDMIRRYLRYRGYNVMYVMNYTDVDDKIIDRANSEEIPPELVAKKYTVAFESDMATLGVEPADVLARATDHVGDMIEAIGGLIEKGLAYPTDGGDVFFSVEGFPGYGKLSHRTLDEVRAKERVEPHPGKRHPVDFSLWKAAKPGEPSWDSPWGPGRPGWHIECSVMSTKYLGMGFDIHGGASDLTFPHHENEIAQAEGLFGTEPFVRYWLHAGLVQMETEKMSKSLGNIVLARDVVRAYGEAARYWALMASYRTQMVFSDDALEDARASYERWRTFHDSISRELGEEMPMVPELLLRRGDADADTNAYIARFIDAMDDDLNSAAAFAVIHELVGDGNKLLEKIQSGNEEARMELIETASAFMELTGLLNLRFGDEAASSELVDDLIGYLLELREAARRERAFDRADEIRDRLVKIGVTIEDTPSGPRWRLARPGA